MQDVEEWIEQHDGIDGRFIWWIGAAPTSELYRLIVKPLLSIGLVGSINTERSAKGLKHDILSLKRNRLSDDQALVLYRSAENIRHLMNARKEYCTSNSPLGNSSK